MLPVSSSELARCRLDSRYRFATTPILFAVMSCKWQQNICDCHRVGAVAKVERTIQIQRGLWWGFALSHGWFRLL